MVNRMIIGIALGLMLFFGSNMGTADADVIYTQRISTDMVMVTNFDTGKTTWIMGDGATPVIIIGTDDDTDE